MISDLLRIVCIFSNFAVIAVITRANRSERKAVARLREDVGLDIPANCEGRACWTRYRDRSLQRQGKANG